MLACPRCPRPLVSASPRRHGFFGCPECGGEAINLYVLRRHLADSVANALWQGSRGDAPVSAFDCPSCRRPMRRVKAPGGEAACEIDLCPTCHVLWFDPGEYEKVGAARPAAPEVHASLQAARQRLAEELVVAKAEQATDWRPDGVLQGALCLLGMPVELRPRTLARKPWITWSLAAAIVAAGVATFPAIRAVSGAYGFLPGDPFRLWGLTWLSSFFLHAGWVHLLGNLYFLLTFGDDAEDALGPAHYLLLVLGATVLGDLCHALLAARPHVPLIGASGGISGIIVFYALQFPKARIGLWVRIRFLQLSAGTAAGLWVGYQVFGALALPTSAVAYLGHLGGAVAGYLFHRLSARAALATMPARGDAADLGLSLFALLFFTAATRADIYVWTDKDGKTHFSSRAPLDGAANPTPPEML